ncbi:hypothetical protein N431DRAFT_435339 [Stipitochalara longipes BDJ]|nr:hypothetical protein N431DRAFT_435339 [Stipitochalara longipes BDJ]
MPISERTQHELVHAGVDAYNRWGAPQVNAAVGAGLATAGAAIHVAAAPVIAAAAPVVVAAAPFVLVVVLH